MNNTHSFKVGDRYQFYSADAIGFIVEYVGPDNKWYIIEGISKGEYGKFGCASSDYTYLGNFSKSHNFDNLYNILNNE